MLAPKAQEHKFWPEKVFSTNNFPPQHLRSQNDQRDVGIILSHRRWVDPPPPARQVGHPRPEPPLNPSRHGVQGGGGGWENGPLCHPPPQSNFLPAQCTKLHITALPPQKKVLEWPPLNLREIRARRPGGRDQGDQDVCQEATSPQPEPRP